MAACGTPPLREPSISVTHKTPALGWEESSGHAAKPLTQTPSKDVMSKAATFGRTGAKRAKVAATACVMLPNVAQDKAADTVLKQTAKRAPGPVFRCWSAMCKSQLFWRIFPWAFSFSIAIFCHLQTLFVTMRIFAEFEDPNAIGLVWLQSLGTSLVIGWCFQDPIIIVIRNNMNCTKTIIRSKKYQVLEKFVVQPFRLAVSQIINFFIHLCGG
mgnify:CR=1 FL=1